MNNITAIHLKAELALDASGKRVDQALADTFPEHSRSRLKTWIEQGQVLIDGQKKRPKDRVMGGEKVEISAEIEKKIDWSPEPLPLNIVYEDTEILVLNKPANCVVHPAAGNNNGTLVNALLHYLPDLNKLPRAGIVHRLDKDTTGLLVVAKTLEAHSDLIKQLQARTIARTYEAIVQGVMTAGGSIDAPLDRHPKDRKRRAVVEGGKPAITHYRVIKRFKAHTHVRLQLETGRTHQIRVHLAYISYPIVGDKVYGGRLRFPAEATQSLRDALTQFPRQALHAKELGLVHPKTKQALSWEAPLPTDMQALLLQLP